MEKLTLEQATNEICQALAQKEVAKEEYNDVVAATLDAYFGEIESTDKKAIREAKASRKTEAKNIVKLAKAMLKGDKDAAKEEADNMAELIDKLG